MIFAKIAADLDSHPKVRRAGRDGREIFLFVLRKNALADFNGIVPKLHMEPWYLADQLMMSEEEAVTGLTRCVSAGLIAQTDTGFAISGWDDEWAKRPLTESERKAKQRHKTADTITYVDESRNVTNTIVTDRDCPECHGSDQIREEEIRGEENTQSAASPSVGVLKPKRSRAKPYEPTAAELESITRVLTRLGQHTGTSYGGNKLHQKLIADRLREGLPEPDLLKVVGYCAIKLEWKDSDRMRKFLRPSTLFGPETIWKYVEEARSWYDREVA